GKGEVVVAAWVGAELGIVAMGADRQGSAAAPSAHHLRREELFRFWAARHLLQVSPELRHPLVELAEDDIRPIAAEHVGVRHRRKAARLVGVAEDELAGLEGLFARIRAGKVAPLDGGIADSIPEAELLPARCQRAAVLPPDCFDAAERLPDLLRAREGGLELG